MSPTTTLAAPPAADAAATATAVLLERYKYVLGQKAALNERTFKFFSLYQTLATGLATAMIALFVGWKSLGLTTDIAISAFLLLMATLGALSLFVIASILAGIAAWLECDKEERELRGSLGGVAVRARDHASIWSWFETWMILFIIGFCAAAAVAYFGVVQAHLKA